MCVVNYTSDPNYEAISGNATIRVSGQFETNELSPNTNYNFRSILLINRTLSVINVINVTTEKGIMPVIAANVP